MLIEETGTAPVEDGRGELRTAIEARRDPLKRLTQLTEAVKRAEELLQTAETKLHQFSGLEREIETATASRIEAWATDGGDAPDLKLDPKFAERRKRRDEAERNVGAAKSALASLRTQLEKAQRTFAFADLEVSHAATQILIQEAQPIAERLIQARHEVWALEDALDSLSMQTFHNRAGLRHPTPIGERASKALHLTERPKQPAGPSTATQAWRALHAALCAGDADAQLGSI